MQYLGIPSIIIICYLIGEISKLLLRKKRNYKYIPIIVGISGGILGLISYYISPNIVLTVKVDESRVPFIKKYLEENYTNILNIYWL